MGNYRLIMEEESMGKPGKYDMWWVALYMIVVICMYAYDRWFYSG